MEREKIRRAVLTILLILFYIKIIWLETWALLIYYPHDINMVWVGWVIFFDYILFYVYCRYLMGLRIPTIICLMLSMAISVAAMSYLWRDIYHIFGSYMVIYSVI